MQWLIPSLVTRYFHKYCTCSDSRDIIAYAYIAYIFMTSSSHSLYFNPSRQDRSSSQPAKKSLKTVVFNSFWSASEMTFLFFYL